LRESHENQRFDDFVALVVMAKNHYVPAQAGLSSRNAVIEGIVRHQEVRIEVAAYAGFDFRRVEGWWLSAPRKVPEMDTRLPME